MLPQYERHVLGWLKHKGIKYAERMRYSAESNEGMVSEGIELEIFVRDTLHGLLGFSCMDESYVGFPALYIGVGSTKGLLLFLF